MKCQAMTSDVIVPITCTCIIMITLLKFVLRFVCMRAFLTHERSCSKPLSAPSYSSPTFPPPPPLLLLLLLQGFLKQCFTKLVEVYTTPLQSLTSVIQGEQNHTFPTPGDQELEALDTSPYLEAIV